MDGEASVKKAYEAILNHDFEMAIEWFEEAIAIEPENAAYHYKLSITYSRSGKWAKAKEHAERACSLDPGQEEYKLQIRLLEAKGNVHQAERLAQGTSSDLLHAIKLLKKAIVMDPLLVQAYLLLAEIYREFAEFETAAAYAKEAYKLDPSNLAAAKLVQDCEAKFRYRK
ncbi:tetratricopeptide repeat protein [Paenibacillus gansuensis]|uniref:Tetratricopeptide repeat protein n=1 Tax=Paenibacillus gansuensis TaxID=306542 RepID=A0ABW5PAY8_9BACL